MKKFDINSSVPLPVLTKPPFIVKEEGWAGFEIMLEIYFKGLPENDPARKVIN